MRYFRILLSVSTVFTSEASASSGRFSSIFSDERFLLFTFSWWDVLPHWKYSTGRFAVSINQLSTVKYDVLLLRLWDGLIIASSWSESISVSVWRLGTPSDETQREPGSPTVISLFSLLLVCTLWFSYFRYLEQKWGNWEAQQWFLSLLCSGPQPVEHFDFLISDIWTKNEGTRVPNSDLSLLSLACL